MPAVSLRARLLSVVVTLSLALVLSGSMIASPSTVAAEPGTPSVWFGSPVQQVATWWERPPTRDRAEVAAGPVDAAAVTTLERRRSKKLSLRRMLSLVNVVRSIPQKCGKKLLPAAAPIKRNKRLNRAAKKYARKMARNDWFDHDAPDGTDPGERISKAGYRWSRWGENIAAGYDGIGRVVVAWLASPGHCRTLMGSYEHVGFGRAYSKESTYGHYWVQDFASPR